jgi:hypothetical protein
MRTFRTDFLEFAVSSAGTKECKVHTDLEIQRNVKSDLVMITKTVQTLSDFRAARFADIFQFLKLINQLFAGKSI